MSRLEPIIAAKYSQSGELQCVVHDGKFHADELVALTLLTFVADTHGVMINVIRSRDPKIIDSADIVLDVGYRNEGKYFDHHGRDFILCHPNTKYKMATTGLVWHDLKTQILESFMSFPYNQDTRELAMDLVLKRIVIPVDVNDNGQATNKVFGPSQLSLPEIVSSFNSNDALLQEERFHECKELVYKIVFMKIKEIIKQATEDARILSEMISSPEEDKRDGIFVLHESGPWISTVLNHWDDTKDFKVCIFPDSVIPGHWRIQTFPADKYDRNAMRCAAPKLLLGFQRTTRNTPFGPDQMTIKRGAERTGYEDKVVFVHMSGFIGSIEGSLEEAKSFARYWIKNTSTVIMTEEEKSLTRMVENYLS